MYSSFLFDSFLKVGKTRIESRITNFQKLKRHFLLYEPSDPYS